MNIFKSLTLTWWQVGIFKLCLASLGIILGVYLQDFFLKWIAVVSAVLAVTAVYLVSVWWKQVRKPEMY